MYARTCARYSRNTSISHHLSCDAWFWIGRRVCAHILNECQQHRKIPSTTLSNVALPREWKALLQRIANERWTTKLLPGGLMTGPFVRCYRFPPDVTRRWVVRSDFLINSVLVVWTRTRSVCISFIRCTYPVFVTDKRNFFLSEIFALKAALGGAQYTVSHKIKWISYVYLTT